MWLDRPTGVNRLILVLACQVVAILLSGGIALGALLADGDHDDFFPRVLELPLEPLRPGASARAVTEALGRAYPDDTVRAQGENVTITFRSGEFDLRPAFSTLAEHGFRIDRFILRRDLSPMSIAEELMGSVRSLVVLLIALPLTLLIGGGLLYARLLATTRDPWPRKRVGAILLAGLGGGIALAAAVEVLDLLLTALGFPMVEQPWVEAITRSEWNASLVLLIVAVALLAPLGEEMFYRGWAFRYLAPAGLPAAYGVTAVLFAVVHLHPPAVPAYLLYGLGFAALYRWSGSVWTAVLAHATNNSIALVLLLSTPAA